MSAPRHYRPTPSARVWNDEITEPIPVIATEPRPWRHDGTGRHRAAGATGRHRVAAQSGTGRHRAVTSSPSASMARAVVWAVALGVLGFGSYAFTVDKVLSPGDYPAVAEAPPASEPAVQPTDEPADEAPDEPAEESASASAYEATIPGHGVGHGVPDPVPSTHTPPEERKCSP